MRPTALALAVAITLTGAVPATAQAPAPDTADVRCLLVLQVVGRDPKQSEQAAKAIYHYLGRLSSRGSITRIEPILKAEASKLTPQQAQAELGRCGGDLNARTKEFQAINQRLAAQFAAPAAKAAPPKAK